MAFKVNENSYPELYNLIKIACNRLSLKTVPDIYVVQDPRVNSLTVKSAQGFILIFSSVLDLLNDNELLYLIGHELAHNKMTDKPDVSFKDALLEMRYLKFNKLMERICIRIRNLKCFIYGITCRWYLEYLADLGGYEANQNLGASITALAKLGAGKTIGEKIRNNGIIYTSYLDKKRPDKKVNRYVEIITSLIVNQFYKVIFSHPPVADRILVLNKYAEYQNRVKGNIITVVPLNKDHR